jgi:hypothetical protein
MPIRNVAFVELLTIQELGIHNEELNYYYYYYYSVGHAVG